MVKIHAVVILVHGMDNFKNGVTMSISEMKLVLPVAQHSRSL
jgi:hypothetical protein